MLNDDNVKPVQNTIVVVGQQWSWTFNYPGVEGPEGDEVNVYEVGTGNEIPKLVLPVDKTTRFELRSPDVIHDFGVPGFLIKMDVMPGQANHYQVTPKTIGTYTGKCYELCGVYHSRMIFTVDVVSQEDYDAYLQSQIDDDFYSDAPLCGNAFADRQVGLGIGDAESEAEEEADRQAEVEGQPEVNDPTADEEGYCQ